MTYSKLVDLIESLKLGTKLQIGVVFFGYPRNEYLVLPYDLAIHTAPICRKLKNTGDMERRCVECRTKAIQKAMRTGSPFSGYCINGLKEYTHPISMDGEVIGIIFIGNILSPGAGEKKIRRRLEMLGFSEEEDALLETMERYFTDEECGMYAHLIESYIRLLMKEIPDSGSAASEKTLWRDMVNFVDENDTGSLTMKELAEFFHYNEKYLGRQFKRVTGLSLKMYICRRKVERAMELLQTTNYGVTEIAASVGFENISYFNRAFRRFAGVSPTIYRSLNRNSKKTR